MSGLLSLHEIIGEIAQTDRSGKRGPRPKDGEICLKWGKMKDQDPDLIVAGGDGTDRADRRLIMYAFTSIRIHAATGGIGYWDPSIAEELHNRGYDLTTLEFRISKKGATDATDPTRR